MQFKEKQSIYMQIAEYVYEQILTGLWADGERILSIREMAVQMEVNPNTVTRTYNLLQEQGLIYNKRGIGYFTAENASETALRQKRKEFIHSALPNIFKTMNSLKISIEEFTTLYHEHQNKESKNED
jgi:DNA-binding transcriptional regulator YhcF (GntR family)